MTYEPDPTVPPPTRPPEGVPVAPGRRRILRVELAVMVFAAAVPGFVIGLDGITDPESISTDIAVLELIAALLAALGPAAIATYLLWRDGRLVAAGFGRRPIGSVLGHGVLGAVCCFLALWAVAVVITLFLAIGGAELEEVGSENDIELTTASLLAGVAIALTAGVGEEIVYRAYAMTRMEEAGFGLRAVLVVPWAVFTVQHLYQGPAAVPLIGAVAAVFVWLYRWRRSVWPVIVAHVLYDLVTILLAAALAD